MQKKLLIIFLIFLFIVFLVWLFVISLKPQPGEKMLQDGRDHLPEGTKIYYKFNLPTSGDHYPSWISKGFYDEPRPDGNLVHSLEHGYIIIWYDCGKQLIMDNSQWTSIVKAAYAQTDDNGRTQMTQGSEGSPSAKLSDMPKAFSDGSCDSLKNQIKDTLKKNNGHKLIAMPRVEMDSPIILTAWGRIEKLNNVDQSKIKKFIDAFRDAGPEQTVEP